jgi:DNA polymerase (family 10)
MAELVLEKKAVIEILKEIAVLLELAGENPFKTRAYVNGARTLETRTESLADLIESGELGKLKGIGDALRTKIVTLATTGELAYHQDLKEKFPLGLCDLLRVPNLGPKKAKVVFETLGIASLDDLEKACQEGRLADLEGFGEKTQQKILQGIAHARLYGARVLLPAAEEVAGPILKMLEEHPRTIRATLCGSLRRRRETVKDIDLLVSSNHPEEILTAFVNHPRVKTVSGHGGTKASVVLDNGLNADLRVVSDVEFPFARHYFTGSKEHNTQMRARAKERGLRLNEYAFTREDGSILTCEDEAGIFETLDLAYIPPELREGLQEIDWAEEGTLPELVGYDALRGTLHCHTTASDGKATLEEMASAAAALGYEYLGIGDHSKIAAYAGGLDEKRLARQMEEIDAFNKNSSGIRVLKGSEVDILKNGSLDFAEELIGQLDYAVASVHSILGLPEKEMTQRLIRAIESPGITFLGHMTGRLLLRREPYAVNVRKVLEATARNGKWVEINSNPRRLDLEWRSILEARDLGLRFIINPDAHSTGGLSDNRYGLDTARKGGLEAKDIANTRPLPEFLKLLAETRR